MEMNEDFDSESEDDGLSFGLEDEETNESEVGYLTDWSFDLKTSRNDCLKTNIYKSHLLAQSLLCSKFVLSKIKN